jgi:hypothetical protein
MKPASEKQLISTFPLLYSGRYWYSFPGDGWFQIIWDLSAKLEPLIEKWVAENNVKPGSEEHPHLMQIKEKFGGLRFYISHGTPEMFEAIGHAERLSYETCEDCGAPGEVRPGGWLITLCNTCHEAQQQRLSGHEPADSGAGS